MDEFTEMSPLDEIEVLLREMYVLAQRAAGDDCDDYERAALQERFDALRELLDDAADRYELEQLPPLQFP